MWRRWSVLAGFCVALAEGAGRLSIFFGWTPMLELDGKVDLVSNESFQLGVSSTLDPYNDCDEVWADDDLDIVYASGEGYGAWTKTEGFDITNEFEAVFLFAESSLCSGTVGLARSLLIARFSMTRT